MKRKQFLKAIAIAAAAGLLLAGCGGAAGNADSVSSAASVSEVSTGESETDSGESSREAAVSNSASGETASGSEGAEDSEELVQDADAPEIASLTYTGSMPLAYAAGFKVHYYEGGYALIDVLEDRQYLVVPEDGEVPEELDGDIVVLQQPLDNIYLAATSAMALFDAMDGLDSIAYSALEASGWYVEDAAAALENGDMVYAGKYSEPDYELLVDGECCMAIESTMILHTPKVQEMLESLDIPVFIDRSSYETDPLGRTEWIKAYGVMLDKEEEAEAFFEEQAKIMDELEDYEQTDKTVAFFYIGSDGTVAVRNSTDYVVSMIEMAGGNYAFSDTFSEDTTGANVNISMEQFYDVALDADYLIYNASIESALESVNDLTAKDALFADFKAVKEGNVWTTEKSLYQATDSLTDFIRDVHGMLSGDSDADMTFLHKVE